MKGPPVSSSSAVRPEVLAFLRDSKEHPDDDAPRLILADWLEDHGSPADAARAEFIRLQCERARLSEDDPRGVCLEARERQLLQQHNRDWLGSLAATSWDTHFRRGLLRLKLPLGLPGQYTAGVWQAEACAWVDGLDLSRNCLGDTGAQVLASSPLLGRPKRPP